MWLIRLELRLRVLAELDAFVHCSDDFCLAQELTVMNCRDPTATPSAMPPSVTAEGFGQAPHVADSPLGWRCIQIIHVVNDFCFQWVPLRSDSGVGDVEFLQERRHRDRVTHDVTIVHVLLICQASAFLQRMLRVVGTGEIFWATKLEVG